MSSQYIAYSCGQGHICAGGYNQCHTVANNPGFNWTMVNAIRSRVHINQYVNVTSKWTSTFTYVHGELMYNKKLAHKSLKP